MNLQELKDKIDSLAIMSDIKLEHLEVCIPNSKGAYMGVTPVTKVRNANRGIDWNNGIFFIWPEVEMIEKPKGKTIK